MSQEATSPATEDAHEAMEIADGGNAAEGEPTTSATSGCSDTSTSSLTPEVQSSSATRPLTASTASSSSDQQQTQDKKVTLSYPIEDFTPPSLSSSHDLKTSYSWDTLLAEPGFVAAPVTTFGHAPMADCWDQITVGMKVEVECKPSDSPSSFSPCFWVASILRLSGYKALLRYEGFGQDGSKDFWMSVCSDKVHPVGWCSTKGKPLIPPKAIRSKYADWKDFLVKRLTGARTLPQNFYAKVWESVGSVFRRGMKLEVVDKMRICQVRVATIKDLTGRRLFLQYDDVDTDDNGFWCHEESPLIHPVGWAKRVGHQIDASKEYFDRCTLENFDEDDCTEDMFPQYRQPPGGFQAGMKIEAVDPLNLASVCVATIMKVLRFGYIMIRIDGYEMDETGGDWFCYHASSPLIFPAGFAEKNHIKLKPPAPRWEENFTWFDYLRETRSQAAPVGLFLPREELKHGFKVGMKLEAADQMDPRLICVSTISRVVGRLLKVHFDGWEDDYDQWMDCENVDIYPVGWADLVGHKLEGPRQAPPLKKDRRKAVSRKGKKRTSGAGGAAATNSGPGSSAANSSANSSNSNNKSGKRKTATSPGNINSQAASVPVASTTAAADATSTEGASASTTSTTITTTTTSSSHTPPPPVLEPQQQLRVIPRLVDSAGQVSLSQRGRDPNLDPTSWSVEEVSQFLDINECSSLVDSFSRQGVDGSCFLSLTKDDVMKLVNNKIGPCLKVENLLSLLKARMNPVQARLLGTMRK